MSRTIAVLSCAVAGLAAAGILIAVILPAMPVRVRAFEAAAIAGACVVLAASLGARYTRRPSVSETEPHASS